MVFCGFCALRALYFWALERNSEGLERNSEGLDRSLEGLERNSEGLELVSVLQALISRSRSRRKREEQKKTHERAPVVCVLGVFLRVLCASGIVLLGSRT